MRSQHNTTAPLTQYSGYSAPESAVGNVPADLVVDSIVVDTAHVTGDLTVDGNLEVAGTIAISEPEGHLLFCDATGVITSDPGVRFESTNRDLFVGRNIVVSSPAATPSSAIRTDTVPGADDSLLYIAAASEALASRTGAMLLGGNQAVGAAGYIVHYIGNVVGAEYQVRRGDDGIAFKVSTTGVVTIGTAIGGSFIVNGPVSFQSPAEQPWLFNSGAVNGGYLTVQRNAFDLVWIGCAPAVNPALGATTNDAALMASTKLYLEAATSVHSKAVRRYDCGVANGGGDRWPAAAIDLGASIQARH